MRFVFLCRYYRWNYRSSSPTTRSIDPTATTTSAIELPTPDTADVPAVIADTAVWQVDESAWRNTKADIEIIAVVIVPLGENVEDEEVDDDKKSDCERRNSGF